ncbi:hypothetical protein Hanom_Chr03g00254041 [Helianthus anomalus]
MNGPDQIFNYGSSNWIKSCSWFIIQKHMFMIAAQHKNYTQHIKNIKGQKRR